MDEKFGNWLAAARIPLDGAATEQRWQVVESIVGGLDRDSLVELLHFFVAGSPSTLPPEALASALRKVGLGYHAESSAHELRSLAGIALRLSMDGKLQSVAVAVSYGMLCSTFLRPSPPALLDGFAADARKLLARLSEERRSRKDAYAAKEFAITLVEDAKQLTTLPQLVEPVQKALSSVSKALESLSEELEEIDNASRAQMEESNILWWLTAEWSTTAERLVNTLAAEESCLFLADEVARMVAIYPAPVAAAPILARMLNKTLNVGSSRVMASVDASPRAWREALDRRVQLTASSRALCPLHAAIHASLSVDEPKVWLPVFRKMCAISSDSEVSHHSLATQFLHESLWLASLEAVSEGGHNE